mmetsp:Transcript_116776/g.371627  ORF Transcript_116776/g.371627 Transcript_116776/m.371627 type:complete len:212 (+) Transcript_116776:220-855(+)
MGDAPGTGLAEVRAHLKVPGVCRRTAADHAEIGGAHDILVCRILSSHPDALLHWLGEFVELNCMFAELARLLARQRLEVRHKSALTGHILLGCCICSAYDSVIGTLEQPQLAILREFNRVVHDLFDIQVLQRRPRHNDRSTNIILSLNLLCRHEVVAQLEHASATLAAPLSVFPAHAEVLDRHALSVDVCHVAVPAIDRHHTEVRLPIPAP